MSIQRYWRCAVMALFLVGSARLGAAMQRSGQTQTGLPDASAGAWSNSHPDPDEATPWKNLTETRAKMANVERQRTITRDAATLLQVAAELQLHVAREGSDTSRDERIRELDTIERLARSVKDHMKGTR